MGFKYDRQELLRIVLSTPKDSAGRYRHCPFCGVPLTHGRATGGRPKSTCTAKTCLQKWRKINKIVADYIPIPTVEDALKELIDVIRSGFWDRLTLFRAAEKASRSLETSCQTPDLSGTVKNGQDQRVSGGTAASHATH